MKVVSLSTSDWSNFQYNFSESLRSVGVDSSSYVLNSHPFGYPKASEVTTREAMTELCRNADFVIIHHSCNELLNLIPAVPRIIHYAAGTKYRERYNTMNEAFKGCHTFYALPEFAPLVPPGSHYIVGAVDTDYLQPSGYNGGVFAHYPSNPGVKGTATINRIMAEFPGIDYRTSNERVNWQEQINRISKCDVYIELLAPTQGGRPYGSFGITCLEAAALGKLVITQNLTGAELYQDTYDEFPPVEASDENQMREAVKAFIDHPFGVLLLGRDHRDWIIRNHSYRATGERVKTILDGL